MTTAKTLNKSIADRTRILNHSFFINVLKFFPFWKSIFSKSINGKNTETTYPYIVDFASTKYVPNFNWIILTVKKTRHTMQTLKTYLFIFFIVISYFLSLFSIKLFFLLFNSLIKSSWFSMLKIYVFPLVVFKTV